MPRPNFFIIGAPRCGTTAMFDYLRQHPDVFMPQRKEPVYFGADLHKRPPILDLDGYLGLFAPATTERRIGEATVWYLYSDSAPREIAEFDPDARIIAMVRNPVDMMYSLHSLLVFTENEDIIDFREALDAEPDRAAGRRRPPNGRRPEGLLYRRCADYAPHLRRWFDVFGRDAVHVVVFDDFRRDPWSVYASTLGFLGLETGFRPQVAVVNPNKRPRSKRFQRLIHSRPLLRGLARLPGGLHHAVWRLLIRANSVPQDRLELDARIRAGLVKEMTPAVRDLEDLLSRDLSAWRTVHS